MKIFWNATIGWAIVYGDYAFPMTLSEDSSYLVAGAKISNIPYLGKIDSSNGNLIASYNTPSMTNYYRYIFLMDSRALCLHVSDFY